MFWLREGYQIVGVLPDGTIIKPFTTRSHTSYMEIRSQEDVCMGKLTGIEYHCTDEERPEYDPCIKCMLYADLHEGLFTETVLALPEEAEVGTYYGWGEPWNIKLSPEEIAKQLEECPWPVHS